MKTDALIDLLSAHVEPIRPRLLRNTLVSALAFGVAVAVCLMLTVFGVPARAFGGAGSSVRMVALFVFLGLATAGTHFLIKAARPVNPGRKPLVLIALSIAALLIVGISALGRASPATWVAMLFGPRWALCLLCIPLFALAPFGALVWVLRRAAPTDPIATGAATALVAAASGAAVFSCCGPAGSFPFIALWYGGVVLLCAGIGAILGPRLLRW